MTLFHNTSQHDIPADQKSLDIASASASHATGGAANTPFARYFMKAYRARNYNLSQSTITPIGEIKRCHELRGKENLIQ